MPKTKRYRNQLQSAVFSDGALTLPNGDLWIAFYETDPTIDPDGKAPPPIAWDEGDSYPIRLWSIDEEGFAANASGFALTNGTGRAVTARYFVLWGGSSRGTSYFVEQVGAFGQEVSGGGRFAVDPGDIVIEEF